MKIVKEKLGRVNGGKVLDIGTGRGDFIHLLQDNLKSYESIIGIDQFQEMLDQAKDKLSTEVELIKMSGESMRFERETFDTVCLSNTLHHLVEKKGVIEEMKRVVKEDGYLLFNEMFCDDQSPAQQSHVKLHHLGADLDMLTKRMHHEYTYEREEIKMLLIDHGIKIVEAFEFTYDDRINHKVEDFEEVFTFFSKKLEGLTESPRYQELKRRVEDVRDWIQAHGFTGASQLMIIGKK